ncbi:hypothetical protein CDD83_7870 [Cordyceps sp. RAO-2017]|nr:hypothetical protein CDD83_7870 [Cordyceps sp. RAO-2017]
MYLDRRVNKTHLAANVVPASSRERQIGLDASPWSQTPTAAPPLPRTPASLGLFLRSGAQTPLLVAPATEQTAELRSEARRGATNDRQHARILDRPRRAAQCRALHGQSRVRAKAARERAGPPPRVRRARLRTVYPRPVPGPGAGTGPLGRAPAPEHELAPKIVAAPSGGPALRRATAVDPLVDIAAAAGGEDYRVDAQPHCVSPRRFSLLSAHLLVALHARQAGDSAKSRTCTRYMRRTSSRARVGGRRALSGPSPVARQWPLAPPSMLLRSLDRTAAEPATGRADARE